MEVEEKPSPVRRRLPSQTKPCLADLGRRGTNNLSGLMFLSLLCSPATTEHNLRFGGESEVSMVAPLDVFAFQDALQFIEPKWVDCAESVEQARELMRISGPGAYFVLSQETRRKSFYEVDSDGGVYPLPLHSIAAR
jgi:hypothetical protein